jgi:hypothetical protein
MADAVDPRHGIGHVQFSSKASIAASTLSAGIVSCRIHPVSTGCRRIAARRITPVSPMAPQIWSKPSGSDRWSTRRTAPAASITSTQSTQARKLPAPWWFLPCTSAAIAPPRVTNFVPGVTRRNQPRGRKVATMSTEDPGLGHQRAGGRVEGQHAVHARHPERQPG